MKVRVLGMLVGAGLALGGCATDGESSGGMNPFLEFLLTPSSGSYSSYSSSDDDDDSPSIYNMSGGAKAALKAGCRDRYGNNERKYRECIEGDRHSEDALAAGCAKRYGDNGAKIRRCMAGN